MADVKISALPAAAAANLTDLLAKVNDPAGVAVTQKLTIQQLVTLITTGSAVPQTRTITIAGTANQIISSAGAQDLSADRTWTLSLPQSIATSSTPRFARLGLGGAADAAHILLINGGTVVTDTHLADLLQTWNAAGVTFTAFKLNITDTASAAASMLMDLQVGGVSKHSILKSGAVTIAGGTITVAESLLDLTRTWNNAAVTFTSIQLSVTDTASASGSSLMKFTVGGIVKARIDKSGEIDGTSFQFLSSAGSPLSFIASPSDGVIRMSDSGITTFNRLQLGGTSASFPSLKRNGTGIDLRLADDSAYAPLATAAISASGNLTFATDNTYDIGAAGATRPRNIFLAGAANIGSRINFSAAAVLSIASGTNQRAGNATLVGGTVTVSNTTVTANTVVILTRKTSGGTVGTAITYTVSAATSFTINSDNILDTSTFSYLLIEVP